MGMAPGSTRGLPMSKDAAGLWSATTAVPVAPDTYRFNFQVDGARAGGYTEMLKIAALTQAWNVKFAPHAMASIHLHLVAAVPNALFLERLLMFEAITAQVFKDAPVPVDGFMHVPDLPGLGLELDMDFIRERDETSAASRS